ncbi:MAG TPA: hypothetical protein VJ302_37550 [Blastocatellia bacterium]|nr:hypothetical protein [Blastocatellia bacterium]
MSNRSPGQSGGGWFASRIGGEVRLKVIAPSPRRVVTTLAQGELPQDAGILRTIAARTTGPRFR